MKLLYLAWEYNLGLNLEIKYEVDLLIELMPNGIQTKGSVTAQVSTCGF